MSTEFSLPQNLQRLIIDVESHQLPNLLKVENLNDLDKNERELHQSLRKIENEVRIWSIEINDSSKNAFERQSWQNVLQETNQRLTNLKKQSNKTLIEARKKEQLQQKQNSNPFNLVQNGNARNALFGEMKGSEEERKRRRDDRIQNQTADEQLMTASSDVTAALQRAVKSMSTELEKSSYSAQLLDESTISIQQATIQYTSFTDLVESSQKLIKSMERADLIDAIFLLFSFLFFIGSILYILKVRIWDRGIGILSFLFRLFGLTKSRSVADVQEKLQLAKQAALQSSKSLAAQMTSSALSASAAASAAAAAAAIAASQSAQQVAQHASESAHRATESVITSFDDEPSFPIEEEIDSNPIRAHDEL